jgi:hypothetical protein
MSEKLVVANNAAKEEKKALSAGQRLSLLLQGVLIIAAIVLFNVYPHKIGFVRSALEPDSFVPLLAPTFTSHLPWLNLWWGIALALLLVRFVVPTAQPYLRWARLGLTLLGAYIVSGLVLNGPIVGLRPTWVTAQDLSASVLASLERLAFWLNVIVKVGLGIGFVSAIVGAARQLNRLLVAPDKVGSV